MVEDFRLRQDLSPSSSSVTVVPEGSQGRHLWAASSNAPSLGLRMAMELRVLLLLPLCFPGLHAQTAKEEEESLPEGSNFSIQCPYTAQAEWEWKVWCRVRDGICEPLVQILYGTQYPQRNQVTKEKITIEDDPVNRTMSITMADLQTEDSDTYACVHNSNRGRVTLRTISLTVFKEMHKRELERLFVQCKYSTSASSTNSKAWCRRDQTGCKILARTDKTSSWRSSEALEDRALIQDDTQRRIVTITMEKLQTQDSGTYWCALYSYSNTIQIMEVRLSVSKRTQQYTARESGNVSVQCPYSAPDYAAVRKAWCKKGATKSCALLAFTNLKPSRYHGTFQQGRIMIQDDTQRGIVTITMEKLRAQDSGVYWCALYELTQLFRMVEVTLNISEVSAGTTLSGTAGTSQSNPAGNTPAPSSNLNTFILLSVILSVVFILALVSLIALYVRQRKQRGGSRQAEDIYDKAEDIAQLDSTERMESPKDDSKDLKYVTLNFKSRLSSEDPLYCNVEPSQTHRMPEDEDVEYAIIAFKQLPTNDKG